MQKVQHYILFSNHERAIRLYKKLATEEIETTIAPTPRSISKCCGVSLMAEEKDLDAIKICAKENSIEILKIAKIKQAFDPKRNRYC